MKQLNERFEAGQTITVTYKESKSKDGTYKPAVGFCDNAVCFTSMKYREIFPQPNTIWLCKVEVIKENCLIVMPIAPSNSMADRARFYERQVKREKTPKTNYNYKSKNG